MNNTKDSFINKILNEFIYHANAYHWCLNYVYLRKPVPMNLKGLACRC